MARNPQSERRSEHCGRTRLRPSFIGCALGLGAAPRPMDDHRGDFWASSFRAFALVGLVAAVNQIFSLRKWLAHYVNERRFNHGVRAYIPHMSDKTARSLATFLPKTKSNLRPTATPIGSLRSR
jgi:hypothetical protein